MDKTNKITNKAVLAAIRTVAENGADFGDVSADRVIEYVDKTLAQMETKNAKAAEKRAEKRNEDPLRNVVLSVVSGQWQTADDIAAQIEGDDVTVGKVRARLTALVKDGLVNKQSAKAEDADGKKRDKMVYFLPRGDCN